MGDPGLVSPQNKGQEADWVEKSKGPESVSQMLILPKVQWKRCGAGSQFSQIRVPFHLSMFCCLCLKSKCGHVSSVCVHVCARACVHVYQLFRIGLHRVCVYTLCGMLFMTCAYCVCRVHVHARCGV